MAAPAPRATLTAALAVLAAAPAFQGTPPAELERERREFATWLGTSPLSPRRAVALLPVGEGLVLGPPGSDVPIPGLPRTRLAAAGSRVTVEREGRTAPVARGRPVTLGRWQVVVSGGAGRAVATVFSDSLRAGRDPAWYPYDPRLVFPVALAAPVRPGSRRLLAADGTEVEAGEAGTVTVTIGGARQSLLVMRFPGEAEDESELEIYFRDGTAGKGSYPAGRFVPLVPAAGGGYLLDFNRARNPFCAYNTAYPCPAPWRGNTIAAPLAAGEQYLGGGLDFPGA